MKKPVPPLYPLRFREIYRRKIWGGDGLRKILKKKGAPSMTGESWEVAHRDGATSVAANGAFKGASLAKLIEKFPREIMGEEHWMRFRGRFPLLVKFLWAQDRLSLQVHPSDDFAQRYETEGQGKMEAWYVIHAAPEARVIRGVLPGTTVAEFRQHLQQGAVERCLNVMGIKPGDVIFLPPGTVHTAFGGVLFLEVQQNSDVTYRLTDWGRTEGGRPRPLSLEKALHVIDFYSMGVSKYKPSRIPGYPYKRKLLIKCEKFTMELLELGRKIAEREDRDRFRLYTVLRGKGAFRHGPKKERREPFSIGQTFLVPAHMGAFDIVPAGACEMVCSYI